MDQLGISYIQDMAEVLVFEIRLDFGHLLAVFLGLIIFGTIYNQVVAWLEARKFAEGYMGFIVAGGVMITLLGVAIVSIQAALIALVAFFASGIPMILGSVIRYARRREQAQLDLINKVKREL